MEQRFEFSKGKLTKDLLPKDPQHLFEEWVKVAQDEKVSEYNAFVLGTLGLDERISCRIVYMRGISDQGLIFFTNYYSRKGTESLENNHVSVNFFWRDLERQINLEGTIEKVTEEVSDAYFNNRPRESQIGAWASEQSQEIVDRGYLEERVAKFEKEYEGKDVPRPPHWGGYVIVPDYVEFWQGRKSRLHDRFVYSKSDNNWEIKRLAP
jgi:pyridoxamine 5'-phosphate oxidase